MEFVNPIFNCFIKNIILYISIIIDFMSQVLKIVLTVHCASVRSIKSKESFRICFVGSNLTVAYFEVKMFAF